MTPFQPIQTGDSLLQRIQSNISSAFQQFLGNTLLSGTLVSATFVKTYTDVVVSHKLASSAGITCLPGLSSLAGATVFISPTVPAAGTIVLQLAYGTANSPTALTTALKVPLYFFNGG